MMKINELTEIIKREKLFSEYINRKKVTKKISPVFFFPVSRTTNSKSLRKKWSVYQLN